MLLTDEPILIYTNLLSIKYRIRISITSII